VDSDEVTNFDRFNPLADFHNLAGKLVPRDEGQFGRETSLKNVQIRAADTASGDSNDNLVILRCWVGNIGDPPSMRFLDNHSQHRPSPEGVVRNA
jgi:hypothetical protein